MNKSNQKDSSQSIRALIETAAVKKYQELEPEPTQQDYEEATALMVHLFAHFKTKYFLEDEIIPSIQKLPKNGKVLDRIGLEGRDIILSVLKEKQIVNEFDSKDFKRFESHNDSMDLVKTNDQSGYGKCLNSGLRVYKYQTRDELYMKKRTAYNNDGPNKKDHDDLHGSVDDSC